MFFIVSNQCFCITQATVEKDYFTGIKNGTTFISMQTWVTKIFKNYSTCSMKTWLEQFLKQAYLTL